MTMKCSKYFNDETNQILDKLTLIKSEIQRYNLLSNYKIRKVCLSVFYM